jgi:hypothetical protein
MTPVGREGDAGGESRLRNPCDTFASNICRDTIDNDRMVLS